MNTRALFTLGKAAAGGIALHGGSQVECRPIRATNLPVAEELHGQQHDKADEGFLDVFRNPDGSIGVTELELEEAGDYILQHFSGMTPSPAATRPTRVEEADDDSTSAGSCAEQVMQDLDQATSRENLDYEFLVRTSARLMRSPEVQQACMRELQRDPQLKLFLQNYHALPPAPARLLLEPGPTLGQEVEDQMHPLAELFQQIGKQLEAVGEKLQELGRRVGLLFALFGQKLRLLVQGGVEKVQKEVEERQLANGREEPSFGDGLVGGLVTLGTLLFAVALMKRARTA